MTPKRRHNQQTIAWFNDLRKRGLLDLNPSYQRRSVWNEAYKESFIETILLQYPAPAIFLYQEISPEGETNLHVVDGKQRLTAIFEFVDGLTTVSEDAQLYPLRGLSFNNLPVDAKTAFWTYEFTVEYLPTNEETLISNIFERINKNVAKLTRQELRHARFSGKFITAAEQLSDWMTAQLPENFPNFNAQSRKQMKDVELVANLLLLIESGSASYSQDALDEVFSSCDLSWEEEENVSAVFKDTVIRIKKLSAAAVDPPLSKTRLKNQADFYSLFGALVEGYAEAASFIDEDDDVLAKRVAEFLERVDSLGTLAAGDTDEAKYLSAARSNSNDKGPREQRITIMRLVLEG